MSAESKFKVTTEIRQLLIENKAIDALVGQNVFPLIAPDDITGDFIVYQRDEYSKDYSKMGITAQTCKVFITAVSEDYDRSQEIAYQINETLEGRFSNPDLEIKLIDSTEDFGDGKFIQILLFSIE